MTVAVVGVTRTARVIISIIAPRRIDLRNVCISLASLPWVIRVKISWPDFVGPPVYTPAPTLPVSDRLMS